MSPCVERAHVVDVARRRCRDRGGARADEIRDELADHLADRLAALKLRLQAGMLPPDAAQVLGEQRQRGELLEGDESRAQAVVDVVVVVGDLVGDVGELRFEPRLRAVEEAPTDVAELARVLQRAMLENPFARLERQVEPAEGRVPILELVDDAERLQVVLEAAELAHAFVERVLPRVAERRVAEIMGEADRLDEVLVQAQRARDRAGDLRDFERVREPRPVEIAFVVDEHLGLVDEAAERRGVNDAVAIALELRAQRRRRLGMAAAARVGRRGGVRGELVPDLRHSRCSASTARNVSSAGARVTTASPRARIRMSFRPERSAFLSPRM